MADNGIAKVQHYVPQFLLRQFGTGKMNRPGYRGGPLV